MIGYYIIKNFGTITECRTLADYIIANKDQLYQQTPYRYIRLFSKLLPGLPVVTDWDQRVASQLGFTPAEIQSEKHFISLNTPGQLIPKRAEKQDTTDVCLRFNVLVQGATGGTFSINGTPLKVNVGDAWIFDVWDNQYEMSIITNDQLIVVAMSYSVSPDRVQTIYNYAQGKL